MDLRGVNLDGAIAYANFTGVVSGGIVGTPASLNPNWILQQGYLIGPGVNLQGATLANADLTGVMSGGITGTPASLPTGWRLIGGYLMGPGANFRGVKLTNINIQGLDLSSYTLTEVSASGLTGPPAALPTGWSFSNGYLFGPTANLKNFDLHNVSLANANLSNAILDGAMSGGITGTPASLPAGWTLSGGTLFPPSDKPNVYGQTSNTGPNWVNGYLLVPGANLRYAHLNATSDYVQCCYGRDLSRADLTGADLRGANLNNVNFTGAILTGAMLQYAAWYRTICPNGKMNFELRPCPL